MKLAANRKNVEEVQEASRMDPAQLRSDMTPMDEGAGLALGEIKDDRGLLDSLGLGDVDAAMFLGKSRQALNNQLGPKKAKPGQVRPTDYFRLGEILILVSGARQLGRDVDVPSVRHYVECTRAAEAGNAPYRLLMELLDGEYEEIDLEGADTVVFLLPAFADLRASRGDVAMNLLHLAHSLPKGEGAPAVFVLSSTEMQAQMAGHWLGLNDGANCFGREIVDHYLPTVLVYRRERDEPRPYVLTERGAFEAAPRFRSNMIADCVRSMMPTDVAKQLRPEGASRVAGTGEQSDGARRAS
jgi:hypothetical protein